MDFVVSVARIPAPGETVLGSDFQMLAGGKGANQANAAARLALPSNSVKMIGRVGADIAGTQLKASLTAAGVDVSGVLSTAAAPTGVAFITVDASGQNSIAVAPGANLTLLPSDVESLRQEIEQAFAVLVQLETPLETVARTLQIARRAGTLTILDPAPAQSLPASLLSLVDVLTPNESEAAGLLQLSSHHIHLVDVPEIAQALLAMGPRSVVLKLGAQGCYYTDGKVSVLSPGFEVVVKDTTAAGDTFNAALAVALSEGTQWEQALRFANRAASISVTRVGAQASAPARSELD